MRHELEEEVKRRDVLVSSHSSRIAELVEKISVCKKRIVELENQVEGMAEVVEENENMVR